MRIVVDSLEKNPLWKEGKNVIRKRLDVGDYSLEGEESKISIERKSSIDLYATLTAGHARFNKEIERSKAYDYFAIVVDSSYEDTLNKRFAGSMHTKVKGYIIMAIIFTIHIKHQIPIFFANNRKESRNIIKELFKAYIRSLK